MKITSPDELEAACIDVSLGDEPAGRTGKANGRGGDHVGMTAGELHMVRVADVEARAVEWLWQGRLAIGKVTLLGGNPGTGKSTIACDIEARISRGSPWPDGGSPQAGSVVIFSAEDAIDDTLRPRLEAAGADLTRIHVVRAVPVTNGSERTFSLQDDLARLREVVGRLGDVRLVRFDPITSYMGSGIDSHQTADVRAVLEPLARLADEMRVAVLAITHPPKTTQGRAINAFTGSLAFVAAARMAFICIEEPATERRLLLPVKNNLAPLPTGLGYEITTTILPGGIATSAVRWDGLPVTVTASEAIRAAEGGVKRDKLAEATAFLQKQLAEGAMSVNELFHLAEEHEVAEKTLRRAADKLGVVKQQAGFHGGWQWRLPDEEGRP